MSFDTTNMQSKAMAISLENILPSLAKNLYGDDWRISIRELLQNCHDAIADRANWGKRETPAISLTPDPANGTLTFTDNGIGMTLEEVEKYLATVGFGRKREQLERLAKEGGAARGALDRLIGQYGIGFLSSFIIADRVEVVTRSVNATSPSGVRVVFTGETTWYYETIPVDSPGTRVTLQLKREPIIDPVTGHKTSIRDLLNFERLKQEVRRFGDLLPYPINVHRSPSDRTPVLSNATRGPWEDVPPVPAKLVEFLKSRHDKENDPLSAEPFVLSRETDKVSAHGIIYFPTPSQEARASFDSVARVDLFSRRMFITDDILDLLPEWAKFVGVVVECPDLTPTLNRNDVIRHDLAFVALKHALGRQVTEIVTFLAKNSVRDFHSLLNHHTERLYRALLEDFQKSPTGKEDFFRAVIRYIPFNVVDRTRPGGKLMTLPTYLVEFGAATSDEAGGSRPDTPRAPDKPRVYYLADIQALGQYRAMIIQKDIPVIMANHVAEPMLLKAYGEAFPDEASVVDVRNILDIYVEKVDQALYEPLKQFLAGLDGGGPDEVLAATFAPSYVPAIMMVSAANDPNQAKVLEDMLRHGGSVLDAKVKRAMEEAMRAAREGRRVITVTLNASNSVVQKIRDHCARGNALTGVFADVLHELYHNARAVTDPGAAATDHFFEHRNALLTRLLDVDLEYADTQRKHDRLKVQLDAKQKEEQARALRIPTDLKPRNCALLLTDLRGSTRMVGFLDSAESAAIVRDYAGQIKEVVERHGGVVEKFTGDGLFAYFWAPDSSPDELARKASNCACDIFQRTHEFFGQGAVAEQLMAAGGIIVAGCRTMLHFGSVMYGGIAGAPALVGRQVVMLFRVLEKDELFDRCPIVVSQPFLRYLRPPDQPEPLARNLKVDESLPPLTVYPHPNFRSPGIGPVT